MPSHETIMPHTSLAWRPLPFPRDRDSVAALLRAGIPLSLLLDLAGSDPHSAELYMTEPAS